VAPIGMATAAGRRAFATVARKGTIRPRVDLPASRHLSGGFGLEVERFVFVPHLDHVSKTKRPDLHLFGWPPLQPIATASAYVSRSRWTLYRAVSRGELPVAGRHGRTLVFRREDLYRWMLGGIAAALADITGGEPCCRWCPRVSRRWLATKAKRPEWRPAISTRSSRRCPTGRHEPHRRPSDPGSRPGRLHGRNFFFLLRPSGGK